YKGILAYLSAQRLARYVVQPLPVRSFAITLDLHASSPARLTLSWQPAIDPLEPSASPASYRVEERIGGPDAPFRLLAETTDPTLEVDIAPGQIHSYRVIAVNAGGRSFPSEVLSAGYSVRSASDWITVVNGFTRVSAPDAVYSGTLAGFGMHDAGVPWGTDRFTTGRVHEYDRTVPWVDDDNPGFGASGWELEGKAVKGNNFDFTTIHGEAILAAGRSYVSSSVEAFVADSLGTPPAIVDLMLGMQRGCFPEDMQRRLSALAARGTGLMVSGSYVADGIEPGFAAGTLGIASRGPVYGAPGGVAEVASGFFTTFAGGHFPLATLPDADPYRVSGAWAVTTASGAPSEVVMRYDVSAMPAAVALRRVSHGAVTLGFPFETVNRTDARNLLMNQILSFLNEK
ncbi:MAG: fibronectin type III domain-containing protein, partial [Muribaculaceae bacterium]|nr:fibronectin type III domain-containing protein [Muribaculaceae bacterium]